MAKTSDKITGADIFDQETIDRAFDNFRKHTIDARNQMKELKREILKVNSALKSMNIKTLSKAMDGLARSSERLAKAETKIASQSKITAKHLDKMSKSSVKLNNNIGKLGGNMGRAGKSMKGFGMSIGSLMGALGIAGLVDGIIRLGQATYETAKDIDTMNMTLGKVTPSLYEFGRAQEFIADVSERFGLNIVKATKKFSTFYASAKQSNFTLKQTMDIFETFSNAGASLGKSSAELDRIFLALEQMMSKGKVSSEELRRQLGEVLPGSLAIMAKSLNVSNAELEKMLKKGELMTADVLPKFAEEVKRTFGLDNSKRIETMAAYQERLTNAWVKFVKLITENDSFLKKLFMTTLKGGADVLEKINEYIAAFSSEHRVGMIKKIGDYLEWVVGNYEKLFGILYKIGNLHPAAWGIRKFFTGLDEDVKATTEAIEKIEAPLRKMDKAMAAFKKYQELVAVRGGKADANFLSSMLGLSEDNIDATYDMLDKALNDLQKRKDDDEEEDEKKRKKIIKKKTKEIEDWLKKVYKLHATIKEKPLDYALSILGFSQKELNLAKTQIEKDIATIEKGLVDPNLSEKVKENLRKSLAEYKKYFNLLKEQLAQFVDPATMKNARPGATGGPEEDGEMSLGNLLGFTDAEVESIAEKAKAAIVIVASLNEAIAAIQYAAFQTRMFQLDVEEQRMNDYYSDKMKLAEGDDELQKKIRIRQAEDEEKLEKKRRKLEYDRAKARRNQAIADATINIAVAITKAWAESTLTAWLVSGIIASIGAIQIGTILSQPLPKYAMGTDNHKGGLAIVGDGGKQELAISPSGSMYLTSNKPELINMEKGSRVIPDAKEFIQREMIKTFFENSEKNTEMMVDTIADAVIKGFKNTKINNKNNINVSLDYQLWRGQIVN